jgi:hypothetical protein
MLQVKEAVEVAKQHLVSILPEYASGNLQLEELEVPPFGTRWTFTFSAISPSAASGAATNLAEMLRGRRVVKSVEIEAESGQLVSVKNAAA